MCRFSAAGVRFEYAFVVFVHLGVFSEPPDPFVCVELKAGGGSEGYYFYFISKAGFAGSSWEVIHIRSSLSCLQGKVHFFCLRFLV